MTSTELNEKYSQFTGIRKNVSELIENASTDEEKKHLYDHLAWHLKRGLILGRPQDKALFDAILPDLKSKLLPNDEQGEVEPEVAKYTAAEAAAYNLTLTGALAYGAIKTPAVEAVEAQDAVLYKDAEEYNAAKGTELTEEQFEALDEEDKIKTPAVAAVEAQEAVLYTNEEVDAYNATLDGAVKAGDPKSNS